MELHLIRHSPVKLSKKICYGRIDVPMAKSFKNDLKKIKSQLDKKYDVVYTSPSQRCTLVATGLGFNEFEIDEKLFELNFGDWEGIEWSKINHIKLNYWMKNFVQKSPPRGESFNKMYLRVKSFIEELRSKNFNKVLIISHSGVIRCFLKYFLNFPLNNAFRFPVGFNEHYIFNLSKNDKFDSIKKLK